MLKKPLAAVMMLLLMLPAISMGAGVLASEPVEQYACDPNYVNHIFNNMSGSIIHPGDSGELSFIFHNPYNNSMTNISLTAEIYAWANLREYRTIDDRFPACPVIIQSGKRVYTERIVEIPAYSNITYSLGMRTYADSPEGLYYVRFLLEFDYSDSTTGNSTHFVMRSNSYYTREQWEYATQDPSESDLKYYRHGVNVTYLSQFYPVDAIIPYSSFSVHRGIPNWPMWILGGFGVFFAILSYMYYMNDNYGKYPWLDEKTKQMSGKYQELRRRLYERARQK